MLTSVFYFNLYRPYIVGRAGGSSEVGTARRERINSSRSTPEGDTAGRVFVLNKSVRDDIVSHAQAVTGGVTELRSAAGRTTYDMTNFNRTVYEEGLETAVDSLSTNLDSFATGFNRSADFMQNQEQSSGLRAFSEEVIDNVTYNSGRLELLGFAITEEGRLSFDREHIASMTHEQLSVAIGENIEIFEGLRTYTTQMLSEPLAEHMSFRGLTYHYNYQLGRMETDGFSLLEAGMLVDRSI